MTCSFFMTIPICSQNALGVLLSYHLQNNRKKHRRSIAFDMKNKAFDEHKSNAPHFVLRVYKKTFTLYIFIPEVHKIAQQRSLDRR